MLIPVKSVTVAEPPKISMDDTMMFVAKLGLKYRTSSTSPAKDANFGKETYPKNMKMQCARVPHRVATISRKVCAFGAFNFNFAAS